ncbi:glycoside hydrolase family 66 protein [Paenibacillus pasadenensis]
MRPIVKHAARAMAAALALQAVLPGAISWNAARAAAAAQIAGPAASVPASPIESLAVGKARYAPGEAAQLTLRFRDEQPWQGQLHVEIHHLNRLIAQGTKTIQAQPGQGELSFSWNPPDRDFTGYLVKAWLKGREEEAVTAAIDVSSDWKRFPRYGYVSEFPRETAAESDAKLKQLSQEYYLNGYQFYDWMWRHDVSVYSKTDASGKPVRDEQGNFVTEAITPEAHYADLLGRDLYPLSIKQQVAAAQKYGSAAMAYQMNYAARENYEDFGVSPRWGLFKAKPDPAEPQKSQDGFTFDVNGKTTSLFLQDPGNPEWQRYIAGQFVRAANEFGFDGMHLDQWGANDKNFLYGYDGSQRYYSLDYDKIINATKDALAANDPAKSDVTFNMVGGNAEYSAVPNPATKTDFDYSEIWSDRNHYRDLQKVVEDTRSKNGGKAMVIAGYMNYKMATGVKTRGTAARDVPAAAESPSRIAKAHGWVGNFGRKDTDAVTFRVTVPAAGSYRLKLGYGHGNDGGAPEGRLAVNGATAAAAIPFPEKTGWGEPTAEAVVEAALVKGENEVRLTLNTNGLWLNLASLTVSGHGSDKRYDAADAELDNVIVDQYSHVYGFETKGDTIRFEVEAPQAGDYPLSFTYASDWQEASRELRVDGERQADVVFPAAGGWESFVPSGVLAQARLKAGKNIVELRAPADDLGIKLRDMTVGDQKLPAYFAEIPPAASIVLTPSSTDNFGQAGQSVTYRVYADRAVDSIGVLYRTDNEPALSVKVDGQPAPQAQQVPFSRTPGGWGGDMQLKLLPLRLEAGAHEVRLEMATSGQYANVAGIVADGRLYSSGGAAPEGGVQPVVGYASGFDNVNDRVAFEVQAPEDGLYDLDWIYRAQGQAAAVRSVSVNGSAAGELTLDPAAAWTDKRQAGVALRQGSNVVVISQEAGQAGSIQLDRLDVRPAQGSGAVRSYEAENPRSDTSFALVKDTVVNFGEVGQQVTYPLEVPAAGEQSLIFTYANAGAFTTRSVYIDGERAKDAGGNPLKIGLDGTKGKDAFSGDGYVILPHLGAGAHQVTLKMEADDVPGSIQLRGVTVGYFDEPSVRLMDAALASMGATHIELGTAEQIGEGPNMLAHEYYPNRSKKMTESTKEAMKDYYKFFAAYENLLFDSKADADAAVEAFDASGQALPTSRDGSERTLWTTVRTNAGNEGYADYDVIHLINLLDNDSNWRNEARQPKAAHDLAVRYAIGGPAAERPELKVYAATPDSREGAMQELDYVWDGDSIVIQVPELDYWTMLVIDRQPQSPEPQALFGGDGSETSPTPSPSASPTSPPAEPPASGAAASAAPSPSASPAPAVRVIGESELSGEGAAGRIDLRLEAGTGRARIPVAAAGKISAKEVRIGHDGAAAVWKSSALNALLAAAAKDGAAWLELELRPAGEAKAPHAAWTPRSAVYEARLSAVGSDGTAVGSAALYPQGQLEFRVQAPLLGGKTLGLYRAGATDAEWSYAGGVYRPGERVLRADWTESGSYAVMDHLKTFADVPPSHWGYEAIASLAAKQIVTGMTESRFEPSATATRAQLAALLVRTLGLSSGGKPSAFPDIPAGAWHADAVSSAVSAGLILGREDGRFDPDAAVSRQELAVMLDRTLDYLGGQKQAPAAAASSSFSDRALIAAWAQAAVSRLEQAGLLLGDARGQFRPQAASTRAEIAAVLDRLLERTAAAD